ncbi:alpha/beta fold hydrolase [uncultured Psychroserpens sp.]|uniref:alpha/beta fold hydrolase n=1 Tax=uncultured Psychroserpens sp. TaxID=255436 RepID=UPI002625F297|nr:alpha/beta fold hydrolase [uncultured Psychroserpens sp.]
MKKIKIKKRIWVLLIVLGLGGYLLYNVIFVSDIPITEPNVNHKDINTLEITKDTLHDYLNNRLAVIEQGKLVVLEDQLDSISNHIELYFERFKCTSESPLTPIVFLAGGPGSASTSIGRSEYFYLFRALSKYADVILLDQRGVGNSIPNLSCRNSLDTPTEITHNVQQQILKDLVAKCKECANEFLDLGIDLSAYNSYQSVLDIENLRQALGYRKISLYGYSYGTELAQLYIKYFQENVDKVILAGPLGPDHGLKLPLEVQGQFEKMDSLIKIDKKLSKYIPDFMQLVKSTHSGLQAQPKFIQVPLQDAFDQDDTSERFLGDIISKVRPTWDMTLTDEHLQMMVSDQIGKDQWIKDFPSFYYQISQDNCRDVGNLLRNFRRRRLPNALFFTANAASGYTDERWEMAKKHEQSSVFSHFGISYGRFPEVYNAFGVKKINNLNTPVSAPTKTLLIGGTLDGRTPPNQVEDMIKRFPNYNRIIVENAGHNGLLDNDIMNTIVAFIKEDSLKKQVVIHRKLEFKSPVPYRYAINDTIINTIKVSGVKEAIDLYQNLHNQYASVPDYIFNFSEGAIDDIYDVLANKNDYENAIEFLEFTLTVFPNSHKLYRNLGEAYYHNNDKTKAKDNLVKAIALDFFDPRTQALLAKLNRN